MLLGALVKRVLLFLGCTCFAIQLSDAQEQLMKPLPIDVLASGRDLVGRIPIDVSPNGEWVAYTYFTDDTLPGWIYSNTGVPDFDGSRRMAAELRNTRSGETIALGDSHSSSWAPIWSPDGNRLAFYSDEDGEAAPWIWERASRKAHRIPNVIARPYWGWETMRWMSDSRHLLCKILPGGISVAEANSKISNPEAEERLTFPAVKSGEPSVLIYKSPRPKDGAKAGEFTGKDRSAPDTFASDLAILDVQTNGVEKIAKDISSRWYEVSPDDHYIAYNTLVKDTVNGWSYDLKLYDLARRETRVLASNIRLHAGNEMAWSPNSGLIAYHSIVSFPDTRAADSGSGQLSVTDIAGRTREFKSPDGTSFSRQSYRGPLWNSEGSAFFDLSGGKVWRFDIQTGIAAVAVEIPGSRIVSIASRRDRESILSGNNRIWILAHSQDDKKDRLYTADLASGIIETVLDTDQTMRGLFDPIGNESDGRIVFVANDQHHLDDIWGFDANSKTARQITHLNPEVERYALGSAQVISWYALDGQQLHGTLILPSTYKKGQHVPLVVWVYGGAKGSDSVNTFGIWPDPQFDMQVLATRGYAVFYPDAPLGVGTEMADLVSTVITGVNATIEQGFTDPERVAVMGQSYGSYCTLSLIAQTRRFKAAIITGAVLHPDLVADYLGGLDYGATKNLYYEGGQNSMGGTPWQYPRRYLDNSPLYLFDKIETPLLIGQGEIDKPLSASKDIFSALSRLGKDVEYRIYRNEGHVFDHKADVIDFWHRRVEFLDEYLHISRDSNGNAIFDGDHARTQAD